MSTTERMAGACDCHVHVIGPKRRFPLSPARSYTPVDAPLNALRGMLARLSLARVVIVQPSIYGTDNSCTLDAIAGLGAAARGVAVVPDDAPGAMLDDLHARGIRGLRVNIATHGTAPLDTIRSQLEAAAALAARNGWHVQAFLRPEMVTALAPSLEGLPVHAVIDHFGLLPPGAPESADADVLCDLLASGRVWVKLSAPYRIAEDPADPRIPALARRLADANPERVVWGSDWPHTPARRGAPISDEAEQPYRDIDTRGLLDHVHLWFPEPRRRHMLLVDNPARLYGFA